MTHPTEVKIAHAPLVALLTELMEAAATQASCVPDSIRERIAAMTMQTVMFIAQSSGGNDDATIHPISADEVWDFCAHGLAAS